MSCDQTSGIGTSLPFVGIHPGAPPPTTCWGAPTIWRHLLGSSDSPFILKNGPHVVSCAPGGGPSTLETPQLATQITFLYSTTINSYNEYKIITFTIPARRHNPYYSLSHIGIYLLNLIVTTKNYSHHYLILLLRFFSQFPTKCIPTSTRDIRRLRAQVIRRSN